MNGQLYLFDEGSLQLLVVVERRSFWQCQGRFWPRRPFWWWQRRFWSRRPVWWQRGRFWLYRKWRSRELATKYWGPATIVKMLDTWEIYALNCTARPPKLVSLLLWPMHQRETQFLEEYLCQMKCSKKTICSSSKNTICSSSFKLHRSTVFIHCYLGTVRQPYRVFHFQSS